MGILRVAGLVWAETVMEGVFFIMQTYFTDVWKLSFTNAATILNIWGGFYRILPFFFLILADTLLGNFVTLALSGISSTTGIVVITVATTPVFGHIVSGGRCQDKDDTECVALTEKILFITGLSLIALGRGARFASTEPFILDQNNNNDQMVKHKTTNNNNDQTATKKWKRPNRWVWICILVFFFTPIGVVIAFPYVKKWYVLFGVSTCITTFATLFYLVGAFTYNKPKPKPEGSPVTDFVRVFVAAALKRSLPFPKDDDTQLHKIDGEEFQSLSPTRILGFLHKAAIITPSDRSRDGEVKKRSWRICSVSQVESAKAFIRMVPIMSCFIMCGVVSSIGNTYFIEQASHMNSKIGKWEPPLQLLLLIFTLVKYVSMSTMAWSKMRMGRDGAIVTGLFANIYCVACCAVAAAVERRRVHVLRRHDLLDLPDDGHVPMSGAWLYFQISFLATVETTSEHALWAFLERAPESLKRYQDCLVEGVSGFGFICGALSVYVVGKVSEAGGANNWFQYTLNKSRLDRYYWVLTTLSSLNLIAFVVLVCIYFMGKPTKPDDDHNDDDDNSDDDEYDTEYDEEDEVEDDDDEKDKEDVKNEEDDDIKRSVERYGLELYCFKQGSALELIIRHYRN